MKLYSLVLLVIIVSSWQLKAQQYLDLSEKKATALLKKGKKNNLTLHYDEKGICDIESYQFPLKTDFEKKLKSLLTRKEFEWIKINENQYVSNFKLQCLVEVFEEEAPFQIRILRTAWSRELYDLLLKK